VTRRKGPWLIFMSCTDQDFEQGAPVDSRMRSVDFRRICSGSILPSLPADSMDRKSNSTARLPISFRYVMSSGRDLTPAYLSQLGRGELTPLEMDQPNVVLVT
jgi:hypothetical protein